MLKIATGNKCKMAVAFILNFIYVVFQIRYCIKVVIKVVNYLASSC